MKRRSLPLWSLWSEGGDRWAKMNQGAGAEDAGEESKMLQEEGGGRGYLCRAAGTLQAEPACRCLLTMSPTQPSPVIRATCGNLVLTTQ